MRIVEQRPQAIHVGPVADLTQCPRRLSSDPWLRVDKQGSEHRYRLELWIPRQSERRHRSHLGVRGCQSCARYRHDLGGRESEQIRHQPPALSHQSLTLEAFNDPLHPDPQLR